MKRALICLLAAAMCLCLLASCVSKEDIGKIKDRTNKVETITIPRSEEPDTTTAGEHDCTTTDNSKEPVITTTDNSEEPVITTTDKPDEPQIPDGPVIASEGLEIEIWGDYAVVTGIGTCTDTDIVIPSEYNGYPVTDIAESAFEDCMSITSIVIPNCVTNIDDYAFLDCLSLTSIQVLSGNENYISVDGVLFNKDKTELICYPAAKSGSTYTIPDSVTRLGDYAFTFCTSLTSIEIPDNITSIGFLTFNGTALYNNESNWEGGVLYIGKYLIDTNSFEISDNYVIKDGTKIIADYAFTGCESLKNIEIPNSVTSIGMCAFYGCSSLPNIVIPTSVTNISDAAFFECTGLTSIDLPGSLTIISEYLFDRCSNLTSVTIGSGVTTISTCAFYQCGALTNITIPDSVTSIDQLAFCECSSLTSIAIPETVTSISYSAFYASALDTIYGKTGSYAETYANENGISFVAN